MLTSGLQVAGGLALCILGHVLFATWHSDMAQSLLQSQAASQAVWQVPDLVRACALPQVFKYFQRYLRGHKILRRQGLPRSDEGNVMSAKAPFKRRDLHRLGQEDCEKYGGIFYFRLAWFNVRTAVLALVHQCLPTFMGAVQERPRSIEDAPVTDIVAVHAVRAAE